MRKKATKIHARFLIDIEYLKLSFNAPYIAHIVVDTIIIIMGKIATMHKFQ